ncbi:MAG: hypothetical protein ABSB88_05810 [Bryobacteraceae bacterium]|jgi:hypothetical protein
MRRVNKTILLGIARIKRWWNGTPVQVRKAHAYSIHGWTRDENGIYRNGATFPESDSVIFRDGRSWIRQYRAAGFDVFTNPEEYPNLHAAIRRERSETTDGRIYLVAADPETPLLDQGE